MLPLARTVSFVAAIFMAATAFAADRVTLHLDLPSGKQLSIVAELADTADERARGLMFREDFSPGDAMIFVYDDPQPLVFWMKNTPQSLDILYFGGDGAFLNAHKDTEPYSLTSLPSRGDAKFVLEISAGEADRLGIEPGTRLILPIH